MDDLINDGWLTADDVRCFKWLIDPDAREKVAFAEVSAGNQAETYRLLLSAFQEVMDSDTLCPLCHQLFTPLTKYHLALCPGMYLGGVVCVCAHDRCGAAKYYSGRAKYLAAHHNTNGNRCGQGGKHGGPTEVRAGLICSHCHGPRI